MSAIPLARCQFLIPFADIHDEVGGPTTSLLERFRLPTAPAEKADHFVPLLPIIRFAEAVQRSQGITDLGFQASRRLQFCHLSEGLRTLIGSSPTLFTALQRVCKWASLEDTVLHMWVERDDDHVRLCSKLAGTAGMPHLEHSQWLQNVLPIHIVREFAGPDWVPARMGFEARYTPHRDTLAFWQNTRFLPGQTASWIEVPISDLSLPNLAHQQPATASDDDAGPGDSDFVSTLRLMLPSYLGEGTPTVAQVADMVGTSVRSLQRRLSDAGLTFSDMLGTARFDNAARLLRDSDAKIIEVAFSSGYVDHAHFTRAFRRMSGVTPRQYREQSRLR